MAGSTTGTIFRVTTFGESHGSAIGAVIDGCPAGLKIDFGRIRAELDKRRPSSKYSTRRIEPDRFEIVSGLFEGVSTGAPICIIIKNSEQRSEDYDNLKDIFRPSHADFGYFSKYGLYDHRGGGRASGRETAARVAAGAIAKILLETIGIRIRAFVVSLGGFETGWDELLEKTASAGDSVGGLIECHVNGLRPGYGEPIFDKLDAELSKAIMSIGAVKGVEFGAGFKAAELFGSQNNDPFVYRNGKITHDTNNSGGVLGGLSTGAELKLRVAIKPVPSVSIPQKTVNKEGESLSLEITGRHDSAVAPRIVPVVEAMTACVLADMILRDCTAKLDNIKKIYGQGGKHDKA